MARRVGETYCRFPRLTCWIVFGCYMLVMRDIARVRFVPKIKLFRKTLQDFRAEGHFRRLYPAAEETRSDRTVTVVCHKPDPSGSRLWEPCWLRLATRYDLPYWRSSALLVVHVTPGDQVHWQPAFMTSTHIVFGTFTEELDITMSSRCCPMLWVALRRYEAAAHFRDRLDFLDHHHTVLQLPSHLNPMKF